MCNEEVRGRQNKGVQLWQGSLCRYIIWCRRLLNLPFSSFLILQTDVQESSARQLQCGQQAFHFSFNQSLSLNKWSRNGGKRRWVHKRKCAFKSQWWLPLILILHDRKYIFHWFTWSRFRFFSRHFRTTCSAVYRFLSPSLLSKAWLGRLRQWCVPSACWEDNYVWFQWFVETSEYNLELLHVMAEFVAAATLTFWDKHHLLIEWCR